MDEAAHSFFDSVAGARVGGRYVVERLLGAGGMGLVAAARYPELEQEVAIKFMLPEHAENAILAARFLREAKLAARVKSAHFVRVFDLGRFEVPRAGGDEGTSVPYLVMELLHGKTLADELAERGPLPVVDVVDYMLQALVGLAELHALGVVHRDLKPSNLFLSEAAGTATLKVLDFGISKDRAHSGGHLTSTGNLLGTPHYMSPEQIKESKATDGRTDLWAIGIILHELLTQTLPFGDRREAPGAIFGAILYVDPPKVRATRPDVPEELEAVIAKCLAREPADRFADAGELAEALRRFAAPQGAARIGAIRKALASAKVGAGPDSNPELVDGSGPSAAATKRGGLVAKVRAGDVSGEAPTVASDPKGLAAAAISGPATLGAQTSNTPARAPGRSRRGWLFAAAAVVIGGGVGAVLATRGPSTAGPAAAPATTASPPSATTMATQGAAASAVTLVSAPSAATAIAVTAPSAIHSAPVTPSPSSAPSAAAWKRPPPTKPPSGPPTHPPATKATGSLLDSLDRK